MHRGLLGRLGHVPEQSGMARSAQQCTHSEHLGLEMKVPRQSARPRSRRPGWPHLSRTRRPPGHGCPPRARWAPAQSRPGTLRPPGSTAGTLRPPNTCCLLPVLPVEYVFSVACKVQVLQQHLHSKGHSLAVCLSHQAAPSSQASGLPHTKHKSLLACASACKTDRVSASPA